MGGLFGVVSKEKCITDLFYGVDYHSHLGTKRGGLAVINSDGMLKRSIHSLKQSYFRVKFEQDLPKFDGHMGIGVISDSEAQPIAVHSHLGRYAICTVMKISNIDSLAQDVLSEGKIFTELSDGSTNATELLAQLINHGDSFAQGIRYAQSKIEGSCTMLILTDDGIIARTALARDVIASALRLRNEKQLKVRQPLQTLFICLPEEKAANIRQFEKNILDELNIREIKYLTDKSVLEDSFLQVNFKAAGAVFKQDVNKFKTALENLSADVMSQLVEKVKNGESTRLDGFDFDIAPDLYVLKEKTKEGIVSVEFDEDGVLALDTVLTDELLKDGAVRDVIRQCQLIRKEAGYVVDQRVTMSVSSDDEFVINALKEKEDYLLSELLADSIVFNGAIDGSDLTKDIDYNDSKIVLQVKKA